MITYTPMYNEMPWTPFFLRHLLDFDCPIHIGEGASEARQFDNDRSVDGSFELLQLFAERWKDRVTVYYHDYNMNDHGPQRKTWLRPRSIIKHQIWDNLKNGDWMIGLAPDNIYSQSDIQKIKKILNNAEDNDYLLMTGQRVFHFNFRKYANRMIPGICGAWTQFWPCIWRKNSEYILESGDELLKHHSTNIHLVLSKTQGDFLNSKLDENSYIYKHVIFAPKIKQFHYKNVKKYTNRVQRFGSDEKAMAFNTFPIDDEALSNYKGTHPSILDTHPWRHVEDCREEPAEFDWREYVDLVTKP